MTTPSDYVVIPTATFEGDLEEESTLVSNNQVYMKEQVQKMVEQKSNDQR